jgi:AraC-like DNA-binding protein
MSMIRIVACVPGTTWERWLQKVVPSGVVVEPVCPEGFASALSRQQYAGAVLSLCPRVLACWGAIRLSLIETRVPIVALSALAAEPLRLLALERELRVVALHIAGVEDHPRALCQSVERLLTEGILQRFVRHFGIQGSALEDLIVPLWKELNSTSSVEAWAALLGRNGVRLARELRALGVRNPRRLLTWLRLLAAWPKLQAGAAAGVVAVDVGYSALPALTRSARKFLGLPPSAAQTLAVDVLIARAAADLVA